VLFAGGIVGVFIGTVATQRLLAPLQKESIVVNVPAQPAPPVTVQMPPPVAPPAVVPSMLPAPVAVLELEPLRALTPHLWTPCVLRTKGSDDLAQCEWDDGLPAISADGKRIAVKENQDDGPRGLWNLAIVVIDAATSRVIARMPLVEMSESEKQETQDEPSAELARIVQRRVAATQSMFDVGGYRTMDRLSKVPSDIGQGQELMTYLQEAKQVVFAIGDSAAIQVIDPFRKKIIWQGRAPIPDKDKVEDETDMCGAPWGLDDVEGWIDPVSRTAILSLTYRSGGCTCPDGGGYMALQL
jgi:hypothetical protein